MDELIEPRFQVVVHNKIQDGYRRAGFALQKGPNLLTGVTETQIAALRADPRLVFGSQDPMPTESIEETEKRLQGNADGGEKSRLENSPLPADLTVEQLKTKLTELGIEFDKSAKKPALVALLETATQTTEPKEDE